MKPKTGIALLIWAAASVAMGVLSMAIGSDAGTLIRKGMTVPMNAAVEAGAIDMDKLEQGCLASGLDAPKHGADGRINLWGLVDWAGAGPADLVRQAIQPLTIAWFVGGVVSGVCGVSCFRGRA